MTNVADAYEIAADWHDKQARMCRDISEDDPRIAKVDRDRALQAAKHHAASSAGLRLAALNIRRKKNEEQG